MNIDTDRFRSALLALTDTQVNDLQKPTSLRLYPSLPDGDAQKISVYYAPFEAVNVNAKVVLIGITPGASQMRRAWRAARESATTGADLARALSEIKRVSAFNDERGQMRPNLYAQLDHWGVARYLGFERAEGLFEEGWGQLQTTSLLPYPTFADERNYNGKPKKPLAHDFLQVLVRRHFVPLLNSIPKAILFPLGTVAEETVRQLSSEGAIQHPCYYGMLHPSGENTYRRKYLCGPRTDPLPSKTNVQSYDEGRSKFHRACPAR